MTAFTQIPLESVIILLSIMDYLNLKLSLSAPSTDPYAPNTN